MAKSGFCNVCYGRVWVTAEGGCANGHAPFAVSEVRDMEPGAPGAPAGPPVAGSQPAVESQPVDTPTPAPPPDESGLIDLPETEWVADEVVSPAAPDADSFFRAESGGDVPPELIPPYDVTLLEPRIPKSEVRRARQLAQLAPVAAVIAVFLICQVLDACAKGM